MALRYVTPVVMTLLVATTIVVFPIVHYRWTYTETKRLREVEPGRVYRSGQMSVAGFEEAIPRYGIKTVINLQNEYPDPDVPQHFFNGDTVKESDLLKKLGARLVWISPDILPRRQTGVERPKAIEEFLEVMDDPASYPVLIHCKAGLHRTGVMVGVYRMEYQGWTPQKAFAEVKANGFGEWKCDASNDYVNQYVLTYKPGLRLGTNGPRARGVSGGVNE